MENIQNKKIKYGLLALIFICILAGLYFRLKGLGKFPLAVDEYYIMQSVRNILKHGLPQFNFSGYYDRGILYQYIVAPLFLMGLKPEFAGRIITVICNMLTLIPLYLVSRKVSGKLFAMGLIFVFCFSVWEVEMARFARMYTPFQMIFVLYLYFLYRNIVENDKTAVKWLLVLSFISIFVYEAGIFLCILNFIPFIWDEDNKRFDVSKVTKLRLKPKYLLLTIIIFAGAYAYLSINFRYLGTTLSALVPSNLPKEDTLSISGGMLRIPKLFIMTLYSSNVFVILYIVPIAAIVYSVFKLVRNRNLEISSKFSLIVLIGLSVFNLFGLIGVLLILFYLIGWINRGDLKSGLVLVFIPIVLNFIFWTIFALKTDMWHQLFPNTHLIGMVSVLKVAWKEFINYPYFYETYALFRDTIPRYTYEVMALIFLGIALLFFKKEKDDFRFRFIFALFIFLILLVNILDISSVETRYFFFLFPLTLLLAYSTIHRAFYLFIKNREVSAIAFLITLFLVFLFSEDFNLRHLINIDSKQVNYRIDYSHELKTHYYPRWDTRTPADIINKNSRSSDIIITNQQVNDFYMKRLNYVYVDYRSGRFNGISMDKGKKERWTGANLVYNDKSLIDLLLKKNKTKWLILNTAWGVRFLKKDYFFRDFGKFIYYATPDSSVMLYKIPAKINIRNYGE